MDPLELNDDHDCHLVPNFGEGHCDHPSHHIQENLVAEDDELPVCVKCRQRTETAYFNPIAGMCDACVNETVAAMPEGIPDDPDMDTTTKP